MLIWGMATVTVERWKIKVNGIVQGVGFRPFIFRTAHKFSLKGFVKNRSDGVLIEVEGEKENLSHFLDCLRKCPPPLTWIDSISIRKTLQIGYNKFRIEESKKDIDKKTYISPDTATCEDCLRELFSPHDRRYLYSFTNCTNCGPRFTIIGDVPYDRENTTMEVFRMCSVCREEYENPLDRRFHAQPNCCPECGPTIYLVDKNGKRIKRTPIKRAASLLDEGFVVAIKGLGGYHLACKAVNDDAVKRLRMRKFREDKPFALMSKSIEQIKEHCTVTTKEKRLLLSSRRPIVLLRKKRNSTIADSVAPKQRYLGFMLPYTPLQHILFSYFEFPLVMTSGNVSDEPICYVDEEAFSRLNNIADYFLVGTRKIFSRCDDSVTRIFNGKEYIIRRSRGYAPEPIKLSIFSDKDILAVGPFLKNTFCFIKGETCFLSHHIGDLENLEALNAFTSEIRHYEHLFDIRPEIVAYDHHPDYLSTKYAHSLNGLKKIGVQHHFAHIASCCAEQGFEEDVIGVAFDGTGYGLDGNIWGGEFLTGNIKKGYKRRGHLKYQPMPGGDMAIHEPWKMALSYLYSLLGDDVLKSGYFYKRKRKIILNMIKTSYNTILTSSAGRLFDAVSAIIGLRERVEYDAQAAVELEMVADEKEKGLYDFDIKNIDGIFVIDPVPIIGRVVEDMEKGCDISGVSARFHNGVAKMIVDVCKLLRNTSSIETVALSGGVFQNLFLLRRVFRLLTRSGFHVLTHSRVPTNDGGISLGQAVLTAYQLENQVKSKK